MSKVAEAYKAGRAKVPYWTDQELLRRNSQGRLQACAIGAFGVGMGIISKKNLDNAYGELDFESGENVRIEFENQFDPEVRIPYKCNCPYGDDETGVAAAIEHYSDKHRRGYGTDVRLIELMEQYGRN